MTTVESIPTPAVDRKVTSVLADDEEDWCGHDSEALDLAARLAHRDTGHPGRLDMCSEELCRALFDAGAD